ncbi:hypothetical protein [Natrononativus amylolyticus]|uniref:hypothetical protein n=1 Tax=Natrononativus amylolyticus TaxID=2963434 RepID=UPI0020CEE296|nr:hypothetical protein [Natrononativus amylolyticus]
MAGSEQSDDGNTQTFGWTYTSDLPCEASNFCRFTMESFEGETTAHIHATQKTGQDMGGGFPEISFWNQVDADPNGGGGCEPGEPCPETDDKPQPGTDEYMDYLNRSENFLKVTAEEHPWRSAEEIEDRDGPFYISLNPRVSGGVIK